MPDKDLIQRANALLDLLDDTANLQPLYLGELSGLARRMRTIADQLHAYADDQLASSANNELDRLTDT